MASDKEKSRKTIPATTRPESSSLALKKAQQSAKIAELRQALIDAGITSLEDQAAALGIWRSTAWTILRRKHKVSVLSASSIKRILRSPHLPESARRVIQEYIEQKCAGEFGHSKSRIRVFRVQLGKTLRE
jgi:hypothetical protein